MVGILALLVAIATLLSGFYFFFWKDSGWYDKTTHTVISTERLRGLETRHSTEEVAALLDLNTELRDALLMSPRGVFSLNRVVIKPNATVSRIPLGVCPWGDCFLIREVESKFEVDRPFARFTVEFNETREDIPIERRPDGWKEEGVLPLRRGCQYVWRALNAELVLSMNVVRTEAGMAVAWAVASGNFDAEVLTKWGNIQGLGLVEFKECNTGLPPLR